MPVVLGFRVVSGLGFRGAPLELQDGLHVTLSRNNPKLKPVSRSPTAFMKPAQDPHYTVLDLYKMST